MIEKIITDLVIAPAGVFSLVSMAEYLACFENTYKEAPKASRQERLGLARDRFRELYFDRKGYLIAAAFTSPFYIKFIAENILK
jgi:hypothetical protein